MKKMIFMMLGIFLISLVSAQAGGGSKLVEIPCEEWCNNSLPYRTFCSENNECQIDLESKDKYMKQFDGECSNYFHTSSDEYMDCWNWWMDYYNQKIDRNLKIVVFNVVLIGILVFINIIFLLSKSLKKRK